jgi:hypothetical protein
MSHFIDVETPCLRERNKRTGISRCHNRILPVYLKIMMHKILFRNQKGKFVTTSRWIYMIKHASDESVKKYKTRSIAIFFSQTEGVFHNETLDAVNLKHFHPYLHP